MKKLLLLCSVVTLLLSSCAEVDLNKPSANSQASTKTVSSSSYQSTQAKEFKGEVGDFIKVDEDKVLINAETVSDGDTHYFNSILSNGKPVYFFIVKSPDGNLRAAANGCRVCGGAMEGFRREGEFMVCNTCGNQYPLDKIATEKGGCNPVPINPDLEVDSDGFISISNSDLESVQPFFQ